MNTITLEAVESSQIHSIGHDANTNTLSIRFKSKAGAGSLYHYSNFSIADWEAFRAAESKGSHFGKFIKPEKDKYPFVRIDESQAA
jgi:hypothetical protein